MRVPQEIAGSARLLGHEQLDEMCPRRHRLGNRAAPLDEKPAGIIPPGPPEELARRLDALVLWAGYDFAQDALANDVLATSTSSAKASGSLTASSARTFRSSSTSASRRPETRRL